MTLKGNNNCYTTRKLHTAVFVPGVQFSATVYDNKVKQCGAPWWICCKFMTTWCSMAPMYILSKPRSIFHYVKTWRHPQNWKYITYCIVVRRSEPWPQVTCTEKNFVKNGSVVFQICVDRPTDIWYNTTTTTTTILRLFFRDHPGEPVPEENFFWTLWC